MKDIIKDMLKGWKTVPNFLSFLRILMVPVFAVLFMKEHYLAAVIVLALSGLTDFFDGKIARRFNQISSLGKILDPLADKLTQITIAIVFFITFWKSTGLVHTFSVVFLVFLIKEAVMVLGSVAMIALGLRPGAAEMPGKVATFAFYLIMISIMFFGPGIGITGLFYPDIVMIILICISAILTIVAFCGYIPGVKQQLREKKEKKAQLEQEQQEQQEQ